MLYLSNKELSSCRNSRRNAYSLFLHSALQNALMLGMHSDNFTFLAETREEKIFATLDVYYSCFSYGLFISFSFHFHFIFISFSFALQNMQLKNYFYSALQKKKLNNHINNYSHIKDGITVKKYIK